MADDVRVRLWVDGTSRFVGDMRKAGRAARGLGRDVRAANADARQAAGGMGLLQRMMGLIRPAALIAGAGLAAGALSAAGAGALALGAGLAPLAGLAVSAGAGMLALRTSTGLVQASMGGIAASMKGVLDDFERATPVTNALARTVEGLTPQLLHMRNVAQSRILGGVIDGVRTASPLLGTLTPALARTSTVLGDLARRAGFVALGLGPQLSRVLNTNVGVIRDLGGAGLSLAVVLVNLLDSARPLTTWLAETVAGWAKYVMVATVAGNRSGALADFFDRTRVVAGQLFSIVGSVATTLWNIARAGSSLGGDLVGSLERGAAAMAAWSSSTRGQADIAGFFARAKEPIYAVARLLRDVARAFGSLSGGTALAPLIEQVRTQLLPVLTRVVSGTTAAFGPALVNLVTQLARAFEPLAGSSGPLVLIVELMAKVAEASAWIAQHVPGGAAAISVLAGAFAVMQAVGLASAVSSLMGFGRGLNVLAGGLRMALVATTTLTAAQAAEVGVLGLLRLAVASAWAAITGPIGLVVLAVVGIGAAFVLLYQKVGWFRDAVGAVWGAIKAAVGVFVQGVVGYFNLWETVVGTVASFVRGRLGDVVSFVRGIPGRIAGVASGMFDGIGKAASAVAHYAADRFRQLVEFVKGIPGQIGDIIKSAPGAVGDLIGGAAGALGLATGGTVKQSGWAVVGERGPELIRAPAGATVFDAAQTGAAMAAPQVRMPAAAQVRVPALRRDPRATGGAGDRVDVHVTVGPAVFKVGDSTIGEATARAVTTRKARGR